MTLLVSVLFSSGNERYIPLFSKRYTQEILYNETIEAIRHDDFSLAHAHIQKLIQQPITSHIADIEELYGDILVRENGSTGDILRLYEWAQKHKPHDRLSKKIHILRSSLSDEKTGDTSHSWVTLTAWIEFTSGEDAQIEQVRQNIVQDSMKQHQYLDRSGVTPEDRKQFLRDTIEFTDTNVEPIDW